MQNSGKAERLAECLEVNVNRVHIVDANGAPLLGTDWDLQTHEGEQTNPGVSDPNFARRVTRARFRRGRSRQGLCTVATTNRDGGRHRAPPVSSIPVAAILRARSSYHFPSGSCSSQWTRFEHARRPPVA